jgi:hypothetical protein
MLTEALPMPTVSPTDPLVAQVLVAMRGRAGEPNATAL